MSWSAKSWLPPRGMVARFSHEVLAADLPQLPSERRAAAAEFVVARVAGSASPVRLGVSAVAFAVGAAARVVGTGRVVAVLRRWPVPLVSEYVRLVRSLAYAHVWEHWPDSGADGGSPR